MDNHRIDKFLKNPRKAVFHLSWPIMVGMIVQVLYNVVDTAFVGRLGSDAIAAVTFSFPIFFLLIALNSGVSTGANSLISRLLGAKKKSDAEHTATVSMVLSIALALLVFIAGMTFIKPLFILFGARDSVLTMAVTYMRIVLLGVFFMFPVFLIHIIFVAQGDTKTPVIMQAIALGMNIVLDPIFIFVLGLGVAGAAIATSLTFMIALIIGIYLIRKKSELRFRGLSWDKHRALEILKIGAPASIMMIIMSLYVMFINGFMAHFSTLHVAAFGIASRLESLAGMPIMAFSLSLLTLTGMFFGAKEYEVLKRTAWFGISVSVMITSCVAILFFIFPNALFRIFTSDADLISIGVKYLKIDVFTFPLMAVGFCTARVMQGLGRGMPGLIINLTRVVFVAVPLSYLFVFVMDKGFIWIAYAMVIGGIAANIVAIPWLVISFRKLQI